MCGTPHKIKMKLSLKVFNSAIKYISLLKLSKSFVHNNPKGKSWMTKFSTKKAFVIESITDFVSFLKFGTLS